MIGEALLIRTSLVNYDSYIPKSDKVSSSKLCFCTVARFKQSFTKKKKEMDIDF